MKPYFVIKHGQVGKTFVRALGRTWDMTDSLGVIQAQDVGKRVYLVDGILQAENNDQRDARIGRRSNRFTKRERVLALYTASQWHGDTGTGPVAMLSLSSTRKVHTEEHRQNLVREIVQDMQYLTTVDRKMWDDGWKGWKKDVGRLMELLHVVETCEVGHEWLDFDENNKLNDELYEQGVL